MSSCICVIPQGTVDNNLGPDRLAGPKALDVYVYIQLAEINHPGFKILTSMRSGPCVQCTYI